MSKNWDKNRFICPISQNISNKPIIEYLHKLQKNLVMTKLNKLY